VAVSNWQAGANPVRASGGGGGPVTDPELHRMRGETGRPRTINKGGPTPNKREKVRAGPRQKKKNQGTEPNPFKLQKGNREGNARGWPKRKKKTIWKGPFPP